MAVRLLSKSFVVVDYPASTNVAGRTLSLRALRELVPGRCLRLPASGKCSVDEMIVAAALQPGDFMVATA